MSVVGGGFTMVSSRGAMVGRLECGCPGMCAKGATGVAIEAYGDTRGARNGKRGIPRGGVESSRRRVSRSMTVRFPSQDLDFLVAEYRVQGMQPSKVAVPYYQCSRSPASASSRLPGGALRSARASAACSCISLGSATALREGHRRVFPVSNSACVPLQRKLLIMLRAYTV